MWKQMMRNKERGAAGLMVAAAVAAAAAALIVVEMKRANYAGKRVKKNVEGSISQAMINEAIELMNVMVNSGVLKISQPHNSRYPKMSMHDPACAATEPRDIDQRIKDQVRIRRPGNHSAFYIAKISTADPRCEGADPATSAGTICDPDNFKHNIQIRLKKLYVVTEGSGDVNYLDVTASITKPEVLNIDLRVKIDDANILVVAPPSFTFDSGDAVVEVNAMSAAGKISYPAPMQTQHKRDCTTPLGWQNFDHFITQCGGKYTNDTPTLLELCRVGFIFRGQECEGTIDINPKSDLGNNSWTSPGNNSCGTYDTVNKKMDYWVAENSPCANSMWHDSRRTCTCTAGNPAPAPETQICN